MASDVSEGQWEGGKLFCLHYFWAWAVLGGGAANTPGGRHVSTVRGQNHRFLGR